MAASEAMKIPALFLLVLWVAPLACASRDQAPGNAELHSEPPTMTAATGTPPESVQSASGQLAAPAPPLAASPAEEPRAVKTDSPATAAATKAMTPPVPAARPAAAESQTDSAGRILELAAARYAELTSMQAEFSMSYENPLLRSRTSGTGVLYQQRPDRLLLRFREPAGDVILSDGSYFWVYYPSVDPQQVLRSQAAAGASGGVDLQAQFLGDPTRRFRYTLEGEEAVQGRPAWRLTLVPREPLGYRQLRVWIDQRDYLARRFEITEENGSVRRFELSNLRLDPKLGDQLFRFDVPAGARVITR